MSRKKVFISYSHVDEKWRKRLVDQLSVIEQAGHIDIWDDRKLMPGEDWLRRLDEEMSTARVAVLLVSASFLTSKFILKHEVPQLFNRHEQDGMTVYPLLVRACPWKDVPWMARMQLRPADGKAVSALRGARVDQILAEAASEIAALTRMPNLAAAPANGKATGKRTSRLRSAARKHVTTLAPSNGADSEQKRNAEPALPRPAHSQTSRELFADAVRPFRVMYLEQGSENIDAFVETTRRSAAGPTDESTGKRFAVKLIEDPSDSARADAPAPVNLKAAQIRYWLSSTEPVLLVVCNLAARALYWRWIGDELAHELSTHDPAWFTHDEICLHLPAVDHTDGHALRGIERHLAAAETRGARPLLLPGMYRRIHERAKSAAAELVDLARVAGFESVQGRLVDLEKRLRSATYVVAIAGPARAGKSTLINALLGASVSPTGKFPTTAVTILATAGERNETEIVFKDGRREVGPADASFLAKFATIEQNPDNERGVRLANVRLTNTFLELGVSLLDAPGLHDPSEEIRKITDAALRTAHAVLYVLDVSPAKTGGFFVSAQVVADLTYLRSAAERLFVVLNKDDELGPQDRADVKQYVERTLQKYGVWEHLPRPPMFVSGSRAWSWRQDGAVGSSPIAELEDAVWSHLLKSSSTGWHRLQAAATELTRGAQDFVAILQARRIDGAEAAKLTQWFESCQAKQQELIQECKKSAEGGSATAAEHLEEVRAQIREDLEKRLKGIALNAQLPSSAQLKEELIPKLQQAFSSTWQKLTDELEQFSIRVGTEIEQTLQQARLVVGVPPGMQFVASPLPDFGSNSDAASPEALSGLLWGGLIGLLLAEVSPLLTPWLAAGGWFVGLLIGKEKQRARAIAKIVSKTDEYVQSTIEVFLSDIHTKATGFSDVLTHHIHDRMAVFIRDLKVQITRLGTPLEQAEHEKLETVERKVQSALIALEDVIHEISTMQPHGSVRVGERMTTEPADRKLPGLPISQKQSTLT